MGSPQWASFLSVILAFLVLVSWQLRVHLLSPQLFDSAKGQARVAASLVALAWLSSPSPPGHFQPEEASRGKVLRGGPVKVCHSWKWKSNQILKQGTYQKNLVGVTYQFWPFCFFYSVSESNSYTMYIC